MLEAIAAARSEVLLEMYWVGADAAGARFRDALVACARRGVVVRVLYDDVGSLGLSPSWWAPLGAVGGTVVSYGPIAPWRKRFRWVQVFFRDHRKLLVVDGEIGFAGGINLARPWLPGEEGGLDWRDDAIELRGPIARDLRRVFASTWQLCGRPALEGSSAPPQIETLTGPHVEGGSRASVLANRIGPRPDRRIRRAYLQAIRRARVSVDVASCYFLPGPTFLHALRAACRRGVRVRILIPKVGDIWLASLAVSHLLEDGVEVYAYARRMLHSKTAIVDGHLVIIGSHNLDTLSWRYNLECNVAVDDEAFAENVAQTFGRDIEEAERLDLGAWRRRPLRLRLLASAVARFRMLL
jgi:cardiolipin synthase